MLREPVQNTTHRPLVEASADVPVDMFAGTTGLVAEGGRSSDSVRDPWAERFVARPVDDRRAAAVAERATGELSGVSVLVPADDRRGPAIAERLARTAPDRLRLEQIAVTIPAAGAPLGDRAVALEQAVLAVSSDFVVVPTDHTADFDRLPELLVHMWLEGADVGLMGPTAGQPAVRPADPVARRRPLYMSRNHPSRFRAERVVDPMPEPGLPAPDAAARVAAWLGLSEDPVPGRLVVVRRWVARWLLSDVGRAAAPVEEFADRARVLGLSVVELVDRRSSN